MKFRTKSIIGQTLTLGLALALSAQAAPPEGKGGGKDKGDGTNSGGDGSRTPNPIALSISFRDAVNDAVRSDGFGSYVWNQPEGLRAHIDGDSGGNYGNLYLYMEPDVGRSVYLDIESGCVSGCDDQPFQARAFGHLGIKVVATDGIGGGVCGMQPGDVATIRMKINFADEAIYGTPGPGTVEFDAFTKRNSPCYQATAEATLERGEASTFGKNSWRVSSDDAACVTWPGGREHGGVTLMPFEFMATIIDPDNPNEPDCE